jgi:hypothetical protein
MRPQTFEQRLAEVVPVPAAWLGLESPSLIAKEPGTKRRIILNPTLEGFKFWFGLNMKDISAKDYRAEKVKDIISSANALGTAQTWEDAERAARKLRNIDPRLFGQAYKNVRRHKIVIPQQVADQAEPEE